MQAEVHTFYSDLRQQGVPVRLVPLALCAGESNLCDWPLGVHTFASSVNALGIAIVVIMPVCCIRPRMTCSVTAGKSHS